MGYRQELDESHCRRFSMMEFNDLTNYCLFWDFFRWICVAWMIGFILVLGCVWFYSQWFCCHLIDFICNYSVTFALMSWLFRLLPPLATAPENVHTWSALYWAELMLRLVLILRLVLMLRLVSPCSSQLHVRCYISSSVLAILQHHLSADVASHFTDLTFKT
jgi:hypothetical protein